jgi:CSLREA domain-containing protein
MRPIKVIPIVAVVLSVALVPTLTASASTTFIVNDTGDQHDAAPGDGVCDNGLGRCTLRAAIEEANALPGLDTVTFAITSGDPLIQPVVELPAITDTIRIDGTTQPGYVDKPLVRIDGNAVCWYCRGLVLMSNGSTIRGLSITNFIEGEGIDISGEGNVIEGNFIGVDRDGVTPQPNSTGILDRGSATLIGGASAPQIRGNCRLPCNLISYNAFSGVTLEGTGARLQGNLIGTDISGTSALGNTVGVVLGGGGNTVGSFVSFAPPSPTNPLHGNVISGNSEGVRLEDRADARGTYNIISNLIGTDITGRSALGNRASGITINGQGEVTILRNTVSGNGKNGITISDIEGETSVISIVENKIGVDYFGSRLPNQGAGVKVMDVPASFIQIGTFVYVPRSGYERPNVIAWNGEAGIDAEETREQLWIENNDIFRNSGGGIRISRSEDVHIDDNEVKDHQDFPGILLSETTNTWILGNHIGWDSATGVSPYAAPNNNGIQISDSRDISVYDNWIWYNFANGVLVDGSSMGISITGNLIHGNQLLGIDLNGDGVTPNDTRDLDGGANGQQNYPELLYAATDGTKTVVIGKLSSTPSSTFRVDIALSNSHISGNAPPYAETTCDPSGFGEGRHSGFTSSPRFRTDPRGFGFFSASRLPASSPGEVVTATATDSSGNTSEYSACLEIIDSIPMTMMGVLYEDVLNLETTSDQGDGDITTPLLKRLDAALKLTWAEKFVPASKQLGAFIQTLEVLEKKQQLDSKTVQVLTDQAKQIVVALEESSAQ